MSTYKGDYSAWRLILIGFWDKDNEEDDLNDTLSQRDSLSVMDQNENLSKISEKSSPDSKNS